MTRPPPPPSSSTLILGRKSTAGVEWRRLPWTLVPVELVSLRQRKASPHGLAHGGSRAGDAQSCPQDRQGWTEGYGADWLFQPQRPYLGPLTPGARAPCWVAREAGQSGAHSTPGRTGDIRPAEHGSQGLPVAELGAARPSPAWAPGRVNHSQTLTTPPGSHGSHRHRPITQLARGRPEEPGQLMDLLKPSQEDPHGHCLPGPLAGVITS